MISVLAVILNSGGTTREIMSSEALEVIVDLVVKREARPRGTCLGIIEKGKRNGGKEC